MNDEARRLIELVHEVRADIRAYKKIAARMNEEPAKYIGVSGGQMIIDLVNAETREKALLIVLAQMGVTEVPDDGSQ